jgi:virginiamycin B lyase
MSGMGVSFAVRRARSRLCCSVLALAVLLLGLAVASPAEARIYWGDFGTGTIGRAELDGTGANQGFITGAGSPGGMAVNYTHIYWVSSRDNGTIGRANLDGTGANPNFITGAGNPSGLAVDGAHIYWANNVSGGSIGRANLDGSGANPFFVTGASFPTGVAVDGAHVYWANYNPRAIGRANLDGSATTASFIPVSTTSQLGGVTVNATHIFWADLGGTVGSMAPIGRANLDGTGANPNFITGATNPDGLAVDGSHIYWANSGSTTIGRANLDGTGVNQGFITGAASPTGVALDPPPPSNEFSFGKLKRNKRRGTATLIVFAPGPGELALNGKGLVKQRTTADGGNLRTIERALTATGKVKLRIKAKGRKRRKLNRTGRVKVAAKVTYTPTFGLPATKTRKIRLRKL